MKMIDKVQKLMKERGIKNNRQLSIKSGIPYSTIDGFYRKGTDSVRRPTLIKLAQTLDCSLDYLVDDDCLDVRPPERHANQDLLDVIMYNTFTPEQKQLLMNMIEQMK